LIAEKIILIYPPKKASISLKIAPFLSLLRALPLLRVLTRSGTVTTAGGITGWWALSAL
jgi:hypothetical protein